MRHAVAVAVAVVVGGCSSGESIDRISAAVSGVPIHIAAQNEFYTFTPLSCGTQVGSVISLGGGWFLQESEEEDGISPEEFLDMQQPALRCKLGQYLGSERGSANFSSVMAPNLCNGTCDNQCRRSYDTRAIIIDVEKPGLNDLHEYGDGWSSPERVAVVTAFKRRIAAARAVFPSAKIGFYGSMIPDGRGRPNATAYLDNRQALRDANVHHGLFDNVDFLVPVLYTRFGCHDEGAGTCDPEREPGPGDCDPQFDTIDEMTRQGIEGSRYVDWYLPLRPLLGFGVNNANSCFHRKLILDFEMDDPFEATLGTQISILRDMASALPDGGPIEQIVLWAGQDDPVLPDAEGGDEPWQNPCGRTVRDYTDQICGYSNPPCAP